MAYKFRGLRRQSSLPPRPHDVIAAEQKRHDRALKRGLIAFFAALAAGGGLAFFIIYGPLVRGAPVLQAVLVGLIFFLPLAGALVVLFRVPPPPLEFLYDESSDRALDRKDAQRRAALLSNVFVFGLIMLENFFLWPRLAHATNWIIAAAEALPTILIIGLGIAVLYMKPGLLSSEPDALNDEVTRSFRARAQKLGYLLLLVILAGLVVLAPLNPSLAAHYLPLGVAVGVMLPVLYFVYLDWQASRSG